MKWKHCKFHELPGPFRMHIRKLFEDFYVGKLSLDEVRNLISYNEEEFQEIERRLRGEFCEDY